MWRPQLTLASAPDAKGLAVFFETGWAALYRCSGEPGGPVSRLELVTEFGFHLPEIANPVAAWHEGELWYLQRLAREEVADVSRQQPRPTRSGARPSTARR